MAGCGIQKALAVAVVLVTAMSSAPVAGQAPINRRLSVRKTDQGFVLLGFRAEQGAENRFRLHPRMPAALVRAQLESMPWGEYEDRLSEREARAAARKLRASGVSEAVLVELDRADGQARLIAYEVAPAYYSRENLLRFLVGAFGRPTVVADELDHLTYRFAGAAPGHVLLADALRLGHGKSRWRLHYELTDTSLEPAGPPNGEDHGLITIWPPPKPESGERQPGLREIEVPDALPKGLKQIYPEPETQPAEPP